MSDELPTIEDITELIEGRTYYIKLPNETPISEIKKLGDNTRDLGLKCTIIFGCGEFDIEDVSDQITKGDVK